MAHNAGHTNAQATVVTSKVKPIWFNKWLLLTIVVIICIIVAIVLIHKHDQDVANKRTDTQTQKVLEHDLAVASTDISNQQGVVSYAQQLIAGAASGKYTISKAELGQYHLDEANAFLNLQEYKRAATQFEAVPNLNSSLQLSALQGEVQARYYAGDRTQLIPVFQKLIQLENSSHDPMRSSVVAQYQADIQALQNNQGIGF